MTGMHQAYTTKELAALLRVEAHTSIVRRARREGWMSRPRKGRGGGSEWLLDSMPEETRLIIGQAVAASIARTMDLVSPNLMPETFTVNTLADVPVLKRERAGARALLVSMAREYGKTAGISRTRAYEIFSHAYNKKTVQIPDWVRGYVPTLCRGSLCNWEAGMGKEGLKALAGRQGLHRIGTGIIDATDGMADYIIAEILHFYDVSAASVLEALEARFEGQRLPTLRGLQRWMKQYREENAQLILRIQNPDGWRNKYMAATGSASAGIDRINQLWELDSSPTDIILADGSRHTLLGCVDVATRRVIFHLAKTSNSAGVCALFRKALLSWGKCETAKMDQGADYTSLQVTTAVHDLGIMPLYCTPFSPHEKPHIERMFKTFQHSFVTRLPGYIGHNVADRKAIESRRSFAERISRKKGEKPAVELRYTAEEFQAICTQWAEDIYGEKIHSELGMSPNDAAAGAEGTVVRIADERALDMLLMPLAGNGGIRMVTKKGLRIAGGKYTAAGLGGREGQQVMVRCDEANAGYVYVFDLNGLFICRAEDPLLTGVSLRELALARKARQRAVMNEQVKEARRIVAAERPQDTAAMILAQKSRQAASNREARAASHETVELSTPAIDQAVLAAISREARKPAPATEEELRARAEFEARHAQPKTHENTLQELSGREAFWVALELEEKIRRSEKLTPEQTRWLLGYQSTTYYSSWRAQYDRHGSSLFDGVKIAVAL